MMLLLTDYMFNLLFRRILSSDSEIGNFSSRFDVRFAPGVSAKSPCLDSNSSSRLFSSAELSLPFFCAVLESTRLS